MGLHTNGCVCEKIEQQNHPGKSSERLRAHREALRTAPKDGRGAQHPGNRGEAQGQQGTGRPV